MEEHQCRLIDRVKELERWRDKTEEKIEGVSEDISKLWSYNRAFDERFKAIYDVLAKLEQNFEKIASTIDKAKGWIITGILGPIIIAAIFGALNLAK